MKLQSSATALTRLAALGCTALTATSVASAQQRSLLDYGPANATVSAKDSPGTFGSTPGCDDLVTQLPNQVTGIFADSGCDACGTGEQSLAESFVLAEDKELCEIVFWGGWFPGNVDPGASFDLIIHTDDGAGLPGAAIYSETGISVVAVDTGTDLFSVDEYELTMVPATPVLLTAGTVYWIEIFTDTGLTGDDFFWETATTDAVTGAIGSAFAFETPGVTWGLDGARDLAMIIRGQDPVIPCPDDFLEENDDCGMEVSLGDGTYNGLTVSKTDWDYYLLEVADGDTLQVDLFFTNGDGDTDMFLYEPGACADFASGNVGTTGSVAFGFSGSDNETLTWTNTTGAAVVYTLKVNIYPPTTTGDCNTHDMVISGTSDGSLGDPFCAPANANSTGMPGVLTAAGSLVAADNDLTLTASGLPTNEAGYILNSMNTGSTPVASGILCLGAGKGRHILQVANSGLTGTVDTVLDLTALPRSTGTATVMAGETWYFQFWHRDHGGTSNFTHALCLTFE